MVKLQLKTSGVCNAMELLKECMRAVAEGLGFVEEDAVFEAMAMLKARLEVFSRTEMEQQQQTGGKLAAGQWYNSREQYAAHEVQRRRGKVPVSLLLEQEVQSFLNVRSAANGPLLCVDRASLEKLLVAGVAAVEKELQALRTQIVNSRLGAFRAVGEAVLLCHQWRWLQDSRG